MRAARTRSACTTRSAARAIKQIASGRFGVTSEYLTNADDIQIKLAQGAKPGEGGQLPGNKVYPWIGRDPALDARRRAHLAAAAPRHLLDRGPGAADPRRQEREPARPGSTPSSSASSASGPSRRASPRRTRTSCSSRVTTAAPGASPLTSLKHAGTPWEIGLAETQQTLVLNNLRDRVVVQVDGQLKTGRDVVIGALLGAEEFGFATAPLVVSGCVMMRVCHLDTCPVGVATQNPELRARFTGKPEFVVTFMEFIAEEVRALLAQLGFRTLAGGRRPRRAAGHPRGDRPLEGRGSRPRAGARRPVAGRRHGAAPHQGPGPRSGPRARQPADRAGRRRPRAQRAGPDRPAGPQRQPDGRHDARPRGDQAVRRRRAARRHDRRHAHGLGRPVVRRVPAARHHAAAVRRRQRLRRQGAVGRAHRRAPRPQRGPVRASTTSSPATSSATARPPGRSSCAAWSASGSASATPARRWSSRAWATTAAST